MKVNDTINWKNYFRQILTLSWIFFPRFLEPTINSFFFLHLLRFCSPVLCTPICVINPQFIFWSFPLKSKLIRASFVFPISLDHLSRKHLRLQQRAYKFSIQIQTVRRIITETLVNSIKIYVICIVCIVLTCFYKHCLVCEWNNIVKISSCNLTSTLRFATMNEPICCSHSLTFIYFQN